MSGAKAKQATRAHMFSFLVAIKKCHENKFQKMLFCTVKDVCIEIQIQFIYLAHLTEGMPKVL